MDPVVSFLASPPAGAALLAAAAWAPVTGFPTWPALARGRFGSTLAISVAVGVFVFTIAERLATPVPR